MLIDVGEVCIMIICVFLHHSPNILTLVSLASEYHAINGVSLSLRGVLLLLIVIYLQALPTNKSALYRRRWTETHHPKSIIKITQEVMLILLPMVQFENGVDAAKITTIITQMTAIQMYPTKNVTRRDGQVRHIDILNIRMMSPF
jgi:hypothetical protein